MSNNQAVYGGSLPGSQMKVYDHANGLGEADVNNSWQSAAEPKKDHRRMQLAVPGGGNPSQTVMMQHVKHRSPKPPQFSDHNFAMQTPQTSNPKVQQL